jgi:hypothetical protein
MAIFLKVILGIGVIAIVMVFSLGLTYLVAMLITWLLTMISITVPTFTVFIVLVILSIIGSFIK